LSKSRHLINNGIIIKIGQKRGELNG